MSTDTLAVNGGVPVIDEWPKRHLFGEEEKAAAVELFDRVIEAGNVFGYNGPDEQAYCKEFCDFMGGGFADGVNSGSSAVYVALKAAHVPAFSEVICGPISDPGGIMPIALAGCIPVAADAEPGQFNISPASIRERLNERTGAILVAHIAGIPAELDEITKIACDAGIPVIEDCAQAHGAAYDGKLCGHWGLTAAFSTMSGKHHATGGQGGVVFTDFEENYWAARRFSDRGKAFNIDDSNGNVVASHNLNLNDLSAAIGRVQIRKLPEIIEGRRRSAQVLIEGCQELQTIRVMQGGPKADPVHWFLMLQLDLDKLTVDKATFVEALQAEGVPCNPSYLHLFTQHDWYRNRAVFEGSRFPWDSPEYKGDPDQEYLTPNIIETDSYSFQLAWHEKITPEHANRVLEAFAKVENAFLA